MSTAATKDTIHTTIQLARSCAGLSVLWILKLKKDPLGTTCLQPSGLAIVTNKQLVLPGNGDLALQGQE